MIKLSVIFASNGEFCFAHSIRSRDTDRSNCIHRRIIHTNIYIIVYTMCITSLFLTPLKNKISLKTSSPWCWPHPLPLPILFLASLVVTIPKSPFHYSINKRPTPPTLITSTTHFDLWPIQPGWYLNHQLHLLHNNISCVRVSHSSSYQLSRVHSHAIYVYSPGTMCLLCYCQMVEKLWIHNTHLSVSVISVLVNVLQK